MTMPSLIAKHQKQVTVSKLKKFYSVYSQAYLIAKSEYGPTKDWELSNSNHLTATGDDYKKDFDKYFAKNIKVLSEKVYNDAVLYQLTDGSGIIFYYDTIFCTDYKYCVERGNNYAPNIARGGVEPLDGRHLFLFRGSGETYDYLWSGKREDLYKEEYGCGAKLNLYCARLIQTDGWQINDDYPVKF